MESNMNYTILFQSIEEQQKGKENEDIFSTISQCNKINDQINSFKQYFIEDDGQDFLGFTRT